MMNIHTKIYTKTALKLAGSASKLQTELYHKDNTFLKKFSETGKYERAFWLSYLKEVMRLLNSVQSEKVLKDLNILREYFLTLALKN